MGKAARRPDPSAPRPVSGQLKIVSELCWFSELFINLPVLRRRARRASECWEDHLIGTSRPTDSNLGGMSGSHISLDQRTAAKSEQYILHQILFSRSQKGTSLIRVVIDRTDYMMEEFEVLDFLLCLLLAARLKILGDSLNKYSYSTFGIPW